MAAALGTIDLKVLVQLGDDEPIEIGVMEVDIVTKQKPVTHGTQVHISGDIEVDAEATAKSVAESLQRLSGVYH